MADDRVLIRHPQEPHRPTTMSVRHFDPSVHVLWGEEPSTLPDDFPGREALVAAGFDSLAKVEAVADFDEIPGVGQITEERIVAWFEDMDA